MPHISKRYLKKDDFREIGERFVKTIASISDTTQGRQFLREFFTHTEQIMLSKRLSIIFMLTQGATPYEIENTLKMSPSTVARIENKFEVGKFSTICNYFQSKKRRDKFWSSLETLLQSGLPPRGRGRWKWLFEKSRNPDI